MIYCNDTEYIRQAVISDLPDVLTLFSHATQSMIENGIFQWDDVYPDGQILKDDITGGKMYLYIIDHKLAAAFTINRISDPEYIDGRWKYPEHSASIIHRLCVRPDCQNGGIGTKAVIAAERILKDNGIISVRLDAFPQNPAALRMYQKLGYTNVGTIHLRKGAFYLYEKLL